MKGRSGQAREAAEALAVQALSYIAQDGERLGRFLSLTGIGPAEIRSASEGAAPLTEAAPAIAADVSVAPAPTAAVDELTPLFDALFERLRSSGEPMLGRIERELVERALRAEEADETRAAKLLGVSRAALQKLRTAE